MTDRASRLLPRLEADLVVGSAAGGVLSITGSVGSGKTLALGCAANLARVAGARVASAVVGAGASVGPWAELGAQLGLGPAPDADATFAIARWLTDAAHQPSPVVVCLDDAHHLDEAGRQVVDVVASAATTTPIWIIATLDDSTGAPSTEWLDRLATTLPLGPLRGTEAEAVVRQMAPTAREDRVAAVADVGCGSPLVLRELCESDPSLVLASVSLSARARLAAFGTSLEDHLVVLGALAVADAPQRPVDLASSAGLDLATVDAAVVRGLAHGCLVGSDEVAWRAQGPARLCLETSDPATRRALHATRAELDLADGRYLDAARHLHAALPAIDPRRAIDAYDRAAQVDPEVELVALRGAMEVVRSVDVGSDVGVDVRRRLARAEVAGGGAVVAAELLFEAADLARAGVADTYCRAALELIDAVLSTGSLDLQQKAVPHLVAASAQADDAAPMTRAHMRAITARLATVRGDRSASDQAIAQTFDLVPDDADADASDLVALALSLHRACNGVGRRADAERCVSLARAAAAQSEDPELQLRVETASAYDALDAGNRGSLLQALDAMAALRRDVDNPHRRLESLVVDNAVAIIEGRHSAAERGLAELTALAEQAGTSEPAVLRQLAMLGMETTDFADFLPALMADADGFPQSATLHAAAGLALLRSGEGDQARSIVEGFAAAGYADIGAGGPAPVTAAILAQIIYELGASDLAAGLLDEMAPYGTRCAVDVTGSAVWLGSLDHHRGLLWSTLGDHEQAVASLRIAVEVHGDLSARCWEARSRHALAVALEARRSPEDADEASELRRLAGKASAEFGLYVAPDPPTAEAAPLVFRRLDDGWEFGRGGHRLTDRVGYRYLHRLMSAPGAALAVEDLVAEPEVDPGRARVSVTRALRSALEELSRVDAPLGAWLDASVRTGASCSYVPPAGEPLEWCLE